MNWQPVAKAPMEPDANVTFESNTYLVTDGHSVATCDFARGNGAGKPWADWSMYGGIPAGRISHWMPLPAAPGEPAVDAQENWSPTAAAINALPAGLRAYIHDLVAQSDPAGMVAENTLLRDQTRQLDAMIGRLKAEQASTQAALTEVIGCFDAANIEGLDDALVNNTDARLADLVQRRLLHAGYAAIGAQQALAAHAAAKESP